MRPLLAQTYEPHRVTFPCFVQPKLNGIRALYQGGRFQSRDEIPFPQGLLAHLAEPLSKTFDQSIILDGELYVHGWPLQRILGAVTPVRQEPTEDTLKIEYHVFDVVDFNSSFEDRMKEHCCAQLPPQVTWVLLQRMFSAQEADQFYAGCVKGGWEGMMYRLGDCPYTTPKQPRQAGQRLYSPRTPFLSDKDNRVWHLLKRKDWQDNEFICVGVTEGEGKYKGTLGAFVCSIAEPEISATFTVGSGLTDQQRDFYFANPPIGQLIKVKYLVLSESGIPLNPTVEAMI